MNDGLNNYSCIERASERTTERKNDRTDGLTDWPTVIINSFVSVHIAKVSIIRFAKEAIFSQNSVGRQIKLVKDIKYL